MRPRCYSIQNRFLSVDHPIFNILLRRSIGGRDIFPATAYIPYADGYSYLEVTVQKALNIAQGGLEFLRCLVFRALKDCGSFILPNIQVITYPDMPQHLFCNIAKGETQQRTLFRIHCPFCQLQFIDFEYQYAKIRPGHLFVDIPD
ncbi:hypothetical protein D3C75_843020 [compost metagenome]